MLHAIVFRDVLATHANDHSKFNLMVDILVVWVPFEGFTWDKCTVKGLVEPHWLGGLLIVELLDVSMVVPADTNDLAC